MKKTLILYTLALLTACGGGAPNTDFSSPIFDNPKVKPSTKPSNNNGSGNGENNNKNQNTGNENSNENANGGNTGNTNPINTNPENQQGNNSQDPENQNAGSKSGNENTTNPIDPVDPINPTDPSSGNQNQSGNTDPVDPENQNTDPNNSSTPEPTAEELARQAELERLGNIAKETREYEDHLRYRILEYPVRYAVITDGLNIIHSNGLKADLDTILPKTLDDTLGEYELKNWYISRSLEKGWKDVELSNSGEVYQFNFEPVGGLPIYNTIKLKGFGDHPRSYDGKYLQTSLYTYKQASGRNQETGDYKIAGDIAFNFVDPRFIRDGITMFRHDERNVDGTIADMTQYSKSTVTNLGTGESFEDELTYVDDKIFIENNHTNINNYYERSAWLDNAKLVIINDGYNFDVDGEIRELKYQNAGIFTVRRLMNDTKNSVNYINDAPDEIIMYAESFMLPKDSAKDYEIDLRGFMLDYPHEYEVPVFKGNTEAIVTHCVDNDCTQDLKHGTAKVVISPETIKMTEERLSHLFNGTCNVDGYQMGCYQGKELFYNAEMNFDNWYTLTMQGWMDVDHKFGDMLGGGYHLQMNHPGYERGFIKGNYSNGYDAKADNFNARLIVDGKDESKFNQKLVSKAGDAGLSSFNGKTYAEEKNGTTPYEFDGVYRAVLGGYVSTDAEGKEHTEITNVAGAVYAGYTGTTMDPNEKYIRRKE